MQKTCWIVSLAVYTLFVQRAAADGPLMPVPATDVPTIGAAANAPQLPTAGCMQPYAGNPSGLFCTCCNHCGCHSESIYNLAPGCCEPRRHCFDNAWAGYCERRAHWDTVWCKVGTGALYSCSPCPTFDGRGVALEAPLQPGATACGCCQNH
jgi:hypothetical protein